MLTVDNEIQSLKRELRETKHRLIISYDQLADSETALRGFELNVNTNINLPVVYTTRQLLVDRVEDIICGLNSLVSRIVIDVVEYYTTRIDEFFDILCEALQIQKWAINERKQYKRRRI